MKRWGPLEVRLHEFQYFRWGWILSKPLAGNSIFLEKEDYTFMIVYRMKGSYSWKWPHAFSILAGRVHDDEVDTVRFWVGYNAGRIVVRWLRPPRSLQRPT